MATVPSTLFHTAEDYLGLERQSDQRHQFIDGQIYAMAGESLAHSTICCNLLSLLVSQLRGTPCRGLSPNMKIRSGPAQKHSRKGLFSYADASVVCGEPRFHDEHRDVLLNPTLIVEVLSPSTEAFDRGEKFHRYSAHLDSLRDYLLVSSESAVIDHLRRNAAGEWLFTSVAGLNAMLIIESIGCRLPLAEVYERVEFPLEEENPLTDAP